MISDAEKAMVLTDIIRHAQHGERDNSISDATYEWRLKLLKELRTQVMKMPNDKQAVQITVDKMEGSYHG